MCVCVLNVRFLFRDWMVVIKCFVFDVLLCFVIFVVKKYCIVNYLEIIGVFIVFLDVGIFIN